MQELRRGLRRCGGRVGSVRVLLRWGGELVFMDRYMQGDYRDLGRSYLTLPMSSLCASKKSSSVTMTETSSFVA